MGENAFIAFTVVKVMGYSWQTALGAIFVSGILFTALTLLKIRSWLADSIPESLKIGFAVGIGLFLAFIGLNETGIVQLGTQGAPVHVGNFHQTSVLLAIFGFLLIAFLVGIVALTAISFVSGAAPLPEKWLSLPPDLSPIFLQLNIAGASIAIAYKANLLDENGNLPEVEKPMMCDAIATVLASLLGTTTTGAYVESATGIEAGGKTGLTAVTTAFMFLSALFFSPFLTSIPSFAYGPALIIVGLLMSFTYNIGIGMTAGFVVYPLFKVLGGKASQVKPGLWVLAALSALFFIFYPY